MLTRRSFVQTAGIGAAAFVAARGRENAIWGAFQRDMSATPPVGYYQRSKARFGFGSSTSVAVLLKHHYQWNGSAWIFISEEIINIQSGNPMCP